MSPAKERRSYIGFRSAMPLCVSLVMAGAMLAPAPVRAQITNMTELRDLRVACLESFNSAKARLDELNRFVGQQAERERSASDRLFSLQQTAATAKRRNLELQREVRQCTNGLARAQRAIELATTSYRTAVDSLPDGEDWARDGSAALSELRRAADAAPQDTWKYKRFKEVQAQFVDTLQTWRAAKRSMEQASFDLEMQAAPTALQRTSREIDSAAKELNELERQLAEREAALGQFTRQSEQWGAAIRALREEEAKSREQLSTIRFKFHLVDLKFAAWRMKQSALGDEDALLFPDALEQALESEGRRRPGLATPLPGAAMPSPESIGMAGGLAHSGLTAEEEEAVEQGDTAFRQLLARVLLAQARLRFLSNALQGEVAAVQAAIGSLETLQGKVSGLTDDTGRLAADQESLRRSLETEQQTLAKGVETLDLVKKRFTADHKVISQLLDTAAQRTATLAKGLER